MPRRADTPRDLLFGLLALQTGLIDSSALVVAFHAWTRSEGRSIAEILVDQGAVDLDQRSLLEGLAAQHLKKHDGDADRSLAALEIGPSTRQKLNEVADSDLVDSLATVSAANLTTDFPHDASGRAIGISTSGGQRFRVLRPHAQGGLGAVFVALDAELNREVALKEILDRHADDPAHQAKFLLEAEVTGGLEHPGIVPVYGLGHHHDGRPYYAMRFIKGDNLKEAIERFHSDEVLKADPGARSLALRKLLRRFTDICNAIEYAHSRGILHRDIKPGNVIVGKYGETLVVDWGLAKVQGRTGSREPEAEQTLIPASGSGSVETLPGQTMGTPAYMSPEQAAGDLDQLGPRSDVYSLGATLYSLLTGKTAFEGTVHQVLRDVQDGKFPRPREVDPSIDQALEATCLKAMAKSPDDRYASPKTLADDLDRWSADEPVSAWKEPLLRRTRRWARRHKTGVTAAAASALALLVGLAGVLAVQARANRDLNAKNAMLTASYQREALANTGLKRANDEIQATNLRLVEANDRESKINAELKTANEKVQARFDLAQESIQAFRNTVTENPGLREERFRALRDKLLREAAEFYGKLGALLEGQADRRSRIALADAYHGLGELTSEIGVKPEALAVYRKELPIRRELLLDREPQQTLGLARNLIDLSMLEEALGNTEAALTTFEECRKLLTTTSYPAPLSDQAESLLASIDTNAGLFLGRRGDSTKARESYQRALAIQERLASANPTNVDFQRALATSHHNLGTLQQRTGEPAKALESYGRALAIRERQAAANPSVSRFQGDVASSLENIGYLYSQTGELRKAQESYDRAKEIRERLAAADPSISAYQDGLARALNNLANSQDAMGETSKALENYGMALAISERLASANPTVTEFQSFVATSHNNLGGLFRRLGEHDKELKSYQSALEIREALAAAHPDRASYQTLLASTLNGIGVHFHQRGDYGKAVEAYDRAILIKQRLVSADPSSSENQSLLAVGYYNLGATQGRMGDREKAIETYGKALTILERLSSANPNVIEHRSDAARIHNNIGFMLGNAGEFAKAVESFRRSLAIQERLAKDVPSLTDIQADLATCHYNIATMFLRMAETGQATQSFLQALAIQEQLVGSNPKQPKYQVSMQYNLISLGLASYQAGRTREAVEYLRRGLAISERTARQPADFYHMARYQSRLSAIALKPGSGVAAESARDDADRAIAMVRQAVASGYRDVRAYRGSKDFDSIRSRPDFQEIVKDLAFPDPPFAP